MKRSYILLTTILSLFIFTGCWNYEEVNKMRFVSGVAVDYDEVKEEYIVTSEVVRLIQGGKDFGSTLFQSKGLTVFDAVRDTIIKNARRLYWAHAKVIILSQDIADERLTTVLDYTSRDAEFRDDIWILVSGEKAASEVFEETFEKREQIASYQIDDALKNEKDISTYHAVPAWRFVKDFFIDGVSPTLPIVKVGEKNGEKIPKLGGQAIIKDNKVVGKLDEMETRAYIWVIDELKGGPFTLETEVEGRAVEVTLVVVRNKTKLTPKMIEDKIIMEIDIESDFSIGEIAGDVNVIEKKGREVLKKDAEKEIKKLIEDVVKRVQKEYKSDIFKFSIEVKKKMPQKWREIEPYWEDVFSDMEIKVNVNVNIQGSALTFEPVKVVE